MSETGKNDSNSGSSQELAEDRTNWAEDRTVLANERTFAGWMRTGLASVGVGLGFRALFRATDQIILAKMTASVFIAIGLMIFYLAWRSSCTLTDRLNSHAAEPIQDSRLGWIAGSFSLGAILLGIVLWLL